MLPIRGVALAKSPKGTCQCLEDTGKLDDSLGPCHPVFEKFQKSDNVSRACQAPLTNLIHAEAKNSLK